MEFGTKLRGSVEFATRLDPDRDQVERDRAALRPLLVHGRDHSEQALAVRLGERERVIALAEDDFETIASHVLELRFHLITSPTDY